MGEKQTKILVLSCGTGGGHNSAAKAIVEAFQKQKISCDFKEYLEIINPKVKNCVNRLYIRSTGGKGNVFKVTYHLGELYQKTKIKSPVYGLNSLSHRKLYHYLIENDYQYVITTHLFAAQALTTIKKKHEVHFIAIATDYVCIPFWEETDTDYIIIPNKDLSIQFEKKGFDRTKIKPIGIPVSKEFSIEIKKENCYKELGLDENKEYALIMTGSMGFGNILEIVDSLCKYTDQTNIVICGNNKKLQKALKEKYTLDKVIPVGFTNQISKYMKISELILTKPGGLTTTEAGTINIPIIHTFPIPGCENYNASFFEERGMSKNCATIDEICKETKNLINNMDLRNEMIENQKKYIDKQACSKICDLIIEETKRTRSV